MGHTSGDHPLHIITTFNDKWGDAKPLEQRFRSTRATRILKEEIMGARGFWGEIREVLWSHRDRTEIMERANGRAAKAPTIQAIKANAIRRGPYFDHLKERAMPMEFPSCEYIPRWFKCEPSFNMTCSNRLGFSSPHLPVRYRIPVNSPDRCAEVLAHCFCTRQISGSVREKIWANY